MNSIKVCEYSRSRSFHDDLILQDQASGERSQDHWSSGFILPTNPVVQSHLDFSVLILFQHGSNLEIGFNISF